MNLNSLREEIDTIDTQIVDLICKRMDLANAVATYKSQHNLPILNVKREEEVLSKVSGLTPLAYKSEITQLFVHIMQISKNLQNKILEN